MSTTLFVRSYPADFEWLSYSIKSMVKYLRGIKNKLLVVPAGTDVPDDIAAFFDYTVESFLYQNTDGYVAQQFDKLDAFKYVHTDTILFSDSDCIYTGPFDVSTMFDGDKPILGMTPYTQIEGDAYNWKAITENLLGASVDFEFMRCFPIIHRTDTLRQLAYDIPHLPRKVTGRNISEFNLIGAYAFHHNHPYKFTVDVPQYPCRQFWSWGGITPEIRTEIESYLNAP